MNSKPAMNGKLLRLTFFVFTALSFWLMTTATQASNAVQNRLSGLWYDPALNGQGFQFQVFGEADNAQLFAIWYTHKQGRPIWFYGAAPLSDETTEIDLLEVMDGQFPPDFDADAIRQLPWGTLTVSHSGPDSAEVSWTSDSDPATRGSLSLTRLTAVAEGAQRACMSGSWFNANQSGHGWLSEVIDNNGQRELTVTWYAHLEGRPTWMVGQGPFDGRVAEVSLVQSSGSDTPPRYNSEEVDTLPWGTVRVEFANNDEALISWQPNEGPYTEGILVTERLTGIAGIPCRLDQTENDTAAQLAAFYQPFGGRDAFPDHYTRSIETFLAAQDEVEDGQNEAAKARLESLFLQQPLNDDIWFRQSDLYGLNVGTPIAYYGLRMLETIVNAELQQRPERLNFTALVASCAQVTRPTLPNYAPETLDLQVHPDILADNARVLHQSTDLFRRWLTAITGGMEVNFSVVETTSCATVNFSRERGVIVSYPDADAMVESLPREWIDKTDIWWVIAPSGVPGDGSDFDEVFITGGMGLYGANGAPLILSDDGWFVRKPAHLGSGSYSEIERRLYQPQWFQHEFMHHLYRTWPEFGLEARDHQWFDRSTWPGDFVGRIEPDYYTESLNKRLLTASPSLAEGLKRPQFLPMNAANLARIPGRYERLPVENSYHTVDITLSADDTLLWTNAAGVSWPLRLEQERLYTPADSPYGRQPVLVELTRDNAIAALVFLGERYRRSE